MTLQEELAEIIEQMKAHRVEFDPGLSDAEVAEIEQAGGFQFPPDLRMFLQLGVPHRWNRFVDEEGDHIDDSFPNWREVPLVVLENFRDWIWQQFSFDIEQNDFWMDEWGTRPAELAEALVVAQRYLQTAPILIPIFAHRCLPSEPNLAGNPVLSVYQAIDTICYGYNLQGYLRHEFLGHADRGKPSDYREVPFWSKIVS